MNRVECLTRFILTRRYNSDARCIIYNSDWKHEEEICPSALSVSIEGEDLLNAICEADNIVWNAMVSRCNNCKFRSGESVKPVESLLEERDDTDITGFICNRHGDPADTPSGTN